LRKYCGAASFEVSGQSQDAVPGEATEQQDPRAGKAKRQVVEDLLWRFACTHEGVEPGGGTRHHMADIAHGEDDSLGHPGGAGGVDDGSRVASGQGLGRIGQVGRAARGEDIVQEDQAGRVRPGSDDALAQGLVPTADQRRGAVLHDGNQLSGGLPGVKRDEDDALGHEGEVESDPADAVMGEENAAVAPFQAGLAQVNARHSNLVEQLTPGGGNDPWAAGFLQKGPGGGGAQVGENRFQKIHRFYRQSPASTSLRKVGLRGGR
jgi:hypothetical protein